MKGVQGCRHRVPAVQICHRYPFWAADRDYIAVRITLPGVVSYDLAIERAAATRKVRGFAANLAVDPVMLLSSATLAHTHEMNETIVEKLKQLELKHEVKVLLACEVGSRAWGLDAPSSDYDVKFIYVRRLEWYISIEDNKRDLIDDNSDFDMNGWDLRKALQLLRETNCGVLEWLHSQLIYKADPLFLAKAKALAASAHCRRSLLLAYWGKAGKHYREYIDVPSNNGTVILKKYLFVIQALLSALWINSFSLDSQDLPPADFSTLLHSFQGTVYALPTNIHDIAFKFMTEKRAGTLKTGPRLGFLDEWVTTSLQKLEVQAKKMDKKSRDETLAPANSLLVEMVTQASGFSHNKDDSYFTKEQKAS